MFGFKLFGQLRYYGGLDGGLDVLSGEEKNSLPERRIVIIYLLLFFQPH